MVARRTAGAIGEFSVSLALDVRREVPTTRHVTARRTYRCRQRPKSNLYSLREGSLDVVDEIDAGHNDVGQIIRRADTSHLDVCGGGRGAFQRREEKHGRAFVGL